MNFAFIGSLLWLLTTPEKDEVATAPKELLINGAVYIMQNEADSTVLNAWEPGISGYRPGYVNTTKFRVNNLTTWNLQYFRDNHFVTLRSQFPNHTHNELALVVEQSRDGKRPDTFSRYWNVTYVTRTFGYDRWMIVDCGKGTGHQKCNGNQNQKCLQNFKKGHRVELADCDKTNRRQRWKFCLCSLPALPKGQTQRDRVIDRIPG